MYPDFLGIGAQKAGTTWLHRSLQAHPQIWMPREKELHYFDEKIRLNGGLWSRLRGDRPADMRWRRQFKARFKRPPKKLSWQDVAWDLRYFFGRPSDEWYASLFERGRGKAQDLDLLTDVSDNIQGRTICALGDAAAMPVKAFIKHFRDEFMYHIEHGKCSVPDYV